MAYSGDRDKFSRKFYSGRAWRNCSEAYKRSAGGLCERCKAQGLIVPGDHVHHIVKLTPENIGDPSVSLSWDNLELLCVDCHARLHSDERKPDRRWTIDADGNVAAQC